MVVRVESEYDVGKERAVVIKMFPQEFDIFELGLAVSSLAPHPDDDRPANIVNAHIMKLFKQIVDQIIEQTIPRAADSGNYSHDITEEEEKKMLKVI